MVNKTKKDLGPQKSNCSTNVVPMVRKKNCETLLKGCDLLFPKGKIFH